MADKLWLGGIAAATYDVWTATVGGTIEVGDLFNVTINNKTLAVSATTTVIATTAGDIATAFNAIDETLYPEFAEYTAVAGATTVVFTADTPGIDGTISVTTTESNGSAADTQTFAITHTTTATGPYHGNNGLNWSGGTLPAGTDVAWVQDGSIPMLYGIDFIGGTIAANADLRILQSYEGQIGLPRYNANGYYEYRNQYLKWTLDSLEVGGGAYGNGSSRLRIYAGASLSGNCLIYNTGTPEANELSALNLYADSIAKLQVFGGVAAVGQYLETADIVLTVLQGGSTYFGRNVTFSGAQQMGSGANAVIDGTHANTMNMYGTGTLVTYRGIGTINAYSGSLDLRGTGGTKIVVGNTGRASATNATGSVALSGGLELMQGAQFYDPRSLLATTTTVKWIGCDPTTTTCNFGPARTLTVTV
jgi:hypothetical protein